MILSSDEQWPPFRTHARINNHHMDRLRRKVRVSRADGQRAVEQIEGRHVMRDVHDGRVGIYPENDALYGSDEMGLGAVVCRQSDDGVGHEVLQLWVFCTRCARRNVKALPT